MTPRSNLIWGIVLLTTAIIDVLVHLHLWAIIMGICAAECFNVYFGGDK